MLWAALKRPCRIAMSLILSSRLSRLIIIRRAYVFHLELVPWILRWTELFHLSYQSEPPACFCSAKLVGVGLLSLPATVQLPDPSADSLFQHLSDAKAEKVSGSQWAGQAVSLMTDLQTDVQYAAAASDFINVFLQPSPI